MARPAPRLLAALGPDPPGPADADLLARFAAHRDAGAFELLVYRHAPLVLRACRGVLRDRHAAEDAAQAVFLALARQAGSVRGDTLPGWLFRVARRVAARAAHRQPPRPADADPDALPAPDAAPGPDPAEVRALHEELDRLPAAYRVPVLLCYFGGLTRAEAARRLGWPVGTVDGRVARAKARLAARLTRRGFTPALLAAAAEAVPSGFAGTTAGAAVGYAAGRTSGVKEGVASLATHEIRRTAMTKTAKLVGVVLTLGAVAVGLGAAAGGDPPDDPPRAAAAPAQPPAPAGPPTKASPADPPGKAAPAAEERVTPGAWVRIRSTGTFVHDPLDDVYRVEAGGTLPLSPTYGGRVKVGGMTVVEAEKAVEAQLHKILKGGRVTLTLTDPPTGEADLGSRVRQLEREVRELKSAVEDLRRKR